MYSNVIDSAVRLPARDGRMEIDAWLDIAGKWGISHSVAAPAEEFVAVYNERGNAQMAEMVERYPDRLSALAVANPWYGTKAVESLKSAFRRGLSGVYFHPQRQGFSLTQAIVNPLVEVCLEYDKPVFSHTGTPVCAMPFQLAELARRFPEATFVMGQMGWSDFCGYDAIPAARQAPNILIETSRAAGAMVAEAIKAVGPDRVLFGTDYPISAPAYEFEKIRPLGLSPEILDKYLRDNARRLWKIDS